MTKGPLPARAPPNVPSIFVSDIGYNLHEWSTGTALIVLAGWASLIYRILAEEQILSQDAGWLAYANSVRYRLLPGVW